LQEDKVTHTTPHYPTPPHFLPLPPSHPFPLSTPSHFPPPGAFTFVEAQKGSGPRTLRARPFGRPEERS
jgi:hypothetical protein